MQKKYIKKNSWELFDKIAQRYDIINDILTLGITKYWRSKMVKAFSKQEKVVLDCATGTGEIMFSVMKKHHKQIKSCVGVDLSKNMMSIGEKRKKSLLYSDKISFVHASGTDLPCEANTFDCVTMAFGIRNIENYPKCIEETFRVLKTSGKLILMEFSLPKSYVFKTIYLFYLRHILPLLAGSISGDIKAYQYLNETIEEFPYGHKFATIMESKGYKVSFKPLTFGIVTLYIGEK